MTRYWCVVGQPEVALSFPAGRSQGTSCLSSVRIGAVAGPSASRYSERVHNSAIQIALSSGELRRIPREHLRIGDLLVPHAPEQMMGFIGIIQAAQCVVVSAGDPFSTNRSRRTGLDQDATLQVP